MYVLNYINFDITMPFECVKSCSISTSFLSTNRLLEGKMETTSVNEYTS